MRALYWLLLTLLFATPISPAPRFPPLRLDRGYSLRLPSGRNHWTLAQSQQSARICYERSRYSTGEVSIDCFGISDPHTGIEYTYSTGDIGVVVTAGSDAAKVVLRNGVSGWVARELLDVPAGPPEPATKSANTIEKLDTTRPATPIENIPTVLVRDTATPWMPAALILLMAAATILAYRLYQLRKIQPTVASSDTINRNLSTQLTDANKRLESTVIVAEREIGQKLKSEYQLINTTLQAKSTVLEKQLAELAAQHEETIARLQVEHQKATDDLKEHTVSKLIADFMVKQAVSSAQVDHANAMNDLKAVHERTVSNLKDQHEEKNIELNDDLKRFSKIMDLEMEINRLQGLVKAEEDALEFVMAERTTVGEHLERDATELAKVEERLDDISYGLYNPHFTFQTSAQYQAKRLEIHADQSKLIKAGEATVYPRHYDRNDRKVRMYSKLLLRAFNGECDAAVADVKWNNITKMEERVVKSCTALNDMKEIVPITIAESYLNLKLDELRVVYEFEEKRYAEREEQRRLRELIREEERTRRENEQLEQAVNEAESDEEKYERMLQRAREEVREAELAKVKAETVGIREEADVTQLKLQQLIEQVNGFEAKLDEARRRKERAKSLAEQTKMGHVYIISNIGSFGPNVVKIGMTRRANPDERIDELGSASVPFPYDIHAMIPATDAPALEYELHQHFRERRLNLMSPRREFFRDVSFDEIEKYLTKRGYNFNKEPEARQFRQSVAKRAAMAP